MITLKEISSELETQLLKRVSNYGFKKQRKTQFVRKVGDCKQTINLLETKSRGREEMHIMLNYCFTYELLDKCISYMKGEQYERGWSTGADTLLRYGGNNNCISCYINADTEIEPILDDIEKSLLEYAFPFLGLCDSLDKFKNALFDKDITINWNMILLNKKAWNMLALSIIFEDGLVEDIVKSNYEMLKNTAEVDFQESILRIKRLKEAFENGKGHEFLEVQCKNENGR